jgi:polyribonucleotide nucleotidyltransferase
MGLCSRANEEGLPKQYEVLTDIQGAEDHHCDMDFKVAGTKEGITAIQLDMKVKGITIDMAMEVVRRANTGRLEIMEYMLTILAEPRKELAPTAPKITVIHVDPDKIKVVIGKGGETIDKIIAETGVKIDFDNDGNCCITSRDADAIARTIEIIEGLVYSPRIGDTFDGVITRIENYGIFVNFHGKMIGLAGARNLGLKFGDSPMAYYKLDQRVKVKVVGITPDGKIDLGLA